jgi:hypothetical protein
LIIQGALNLSGRITSTLATGTSPFVVASNTVVANLNSALLNGTSWAAPSPIGNTTPNTGAFTTLSTTGATTLGAGGTFTGTFAGTHTYSGQATFSIAPIATAGFVAGANATALTVGLFINGTNASGRQIRWYSDTTAGTGLRWNITMANIESGSNAGSNLSFNCFDDAGATLFSPISITRATGAITFSSALTSVGNFRVNGLSGFNNTAPIAKPTVSGAKGSNAALASLMTALAAYGLVTDTTTA